MNRSVSYIESLNSEQRKAVEHDRGPLLILAGAGSGKTRVITARIAYLIDQHRLDPYSILAVTFTNKAAREMKERIEGLIGDSSGVMIKTFHSFGAWFLRRNAAAAGIASGFTIYDDQDSYSLLKTLNPELPAGEIKSYRNSISRAKDRGLLPEDDLGEIDFRPDFPRIFAEYQKKIREIGNIDFGDLIDLPSKVLQQQPAIRNRYRQRFKVILVDEYQDTNRAQHHLLQMLSGSDTDVCVVGDDDQSIYRFRGAEVDNILHFGQSFPGTTTIRLEQNYRSTGHILAIASSVVENNSSRLGKTLWTEQEDGKPGVLAYLFDQNAEVQYCSKLLKDRRYGNTAILYRTNAQSRLFETWFLKVGIPYRIVGAVSFYSREEVKDLLAYLAFLTNPRDEVAYRRIINKPRRGIGAKSIDRVFESLLDTGGDWLEASRCTSRDMKGKAAAGLKSFCELNEHLKNALEHPGQNLGDLIRILAEESGLKEFYTARDKVQATSKTENIDELVNAGVDYPCSFEGLQEFLELIELDQSRFEQQQDGEGVTLITIHNTKGLEFDRVIVTGLESGLFPRSKPDEIDPEELEEERRLFYVAITRARRELYFTSCQRRQLYGRTEFMEPSLFLDELPLDHIEVEGGSPSRAGGRYPVGTRVYHDDYGSGEVFAKKGTGKDEVIDVRFESGRTARFISAFCNLEKLASDSW